eukprot:gb/GECG01010601.1/.p1 GENE.gb/GECG01010601.1/~~gb/GECG01010601.1/.p1  ORF type:complete len:102 (+),score=6.73 gb/GECG01010601.1/:1-306(+)
MNHVDHPVSYQSYGSKTRPSTKPRDFFSFCLLRNPVAVVVTVLELPWNFRLANLVVVKFTVTTSLRECSCFDTNANFLLEITPSICSSFQSTAHPEENDNE